MYAVSHRHGPGIPGTRDSGQGREGMGWRGVWDGWREMLKRRNGRGKSYSDVRATTRCRASISL